MDIQEQIQQIEYKLKEIEAKSIRLENLNRYDTEEYDDLYNLETELSQKLIKLKKEYEVLKKDREIEDKIKKVVYSTEKFVLNLLVPVDKKADLGVHLFRNMSGLARYLEEYYNYSALGSQSEIGRSARGVPRADTGHLVKRVHGYRFVRVHADDPLMPYYEYLIREGRYVEYE